MRSVKSGTHSLRDQNQAQGQDGVVVFDDDRFTQRYVRMFPAPIERVWKAVTDSDELPGWLDPVLRVELELGGRVWFRASARGRPVGVGEISAFDPPRRIRFQRPAVGDESDSEGGYLEFELEVVEEGTRFTFTDVVSPDGGLPPAEVDGDVEDEPAAGPEVRGPHGFAAGLDCLGELLTQLPTEGSTGAPSDASRLSRARYLELVQVYYDHIWQKCEPS